MPPNFKCPEDEYSMLSRAESHLEELSKILLTLPKFYGDTNEQAFFGLSKAILTSRRHVSVLIKTIESNGSSK